MSSAASKGDRSPDPGFRAQSDVGSQSKAPSAAASADRLRQIPLGEIARRAHLPYALDGHRAGNTSVASAATDGHACADTSYAAAANGKGRRPAAKPAIAADGLRNKAA